MTVHKIVTDLWHSLEESDSAPLDMERLISAVERCAEALELIASKDETPQINAESLIARNLRYADFPTGPPPADPRDRFRLTNIEVPVEYPRPGGLPVADPNDPALWTIDNRGRRVPDLNDLAEITNRHTELRLGLGQRPPHRPPEDGPEPSDETT